MTFNAVIALILRFFSRNSTDFQADYITVVEARPIMSVKYCLLVPVFYTLAKTITHPAARSLCNSWASCKIVLGEGWVKYFLTCPSPGDRLPSWLYHWQTSITDRETEFSWLL